MVNNSTTTWYIAVQGFTTGSFTIVATLEGSAVNTPPSANAGNDQTVEDSDGDGLEDVTLDGSGSTDNDGTIESYVWREGGNEIGTGMSPTVSFAVGVHSVTLEVTDNEGATDTDTVTITVEDGGEFILLISGESRLDSVSQNDWAYYMIAAASTDTLMEVELSGLSSDVDLYVRKGEIPTLTEYDCRPYLGGTSSETCSLVNSGESIWYIGVQGYTSGSFTITATLEEDGGSTITPLLSGESQSGSVSQGDWAYYLIEASATDIEVEVELSNLSDDVDLYVREGELPTLTEYDCRPYLGGTSSETCTMVNNGATTWYIGVEGFTAGSFTVMAAIETVP